MQATRTVVQSPLKPFRMRIVFRTDANVQIGTGHLTRCLTLAGALKRAGAECLFLFRSAGIGILGEQIEAEGHALLPLPEPQSLQIDRDGPPHAKWLPGGWRQDVELCRQALANQPFSDWLVVDHYALDYRWEEEMRNFSSKLMVIDDLADRKHAADLLLDQNLQENPYRYANLVSANCICLLGPAYALLRPEFAERRKHLIRKQHTVKRILVFVGGTDPDNLTDRILAAWQRLPPNNIALDVVVGANCPHLSVLIQRCAVISNCELHIQTKDMAGLMERADLMVGAPGTSTWERCCLQLPALIVSIADNQHGIGRSVARYRAACYLGKIEQISTNEITNALKKLLAHPSLIRRIGHRAAQLTDGKGTERVAAALSGHLRLTVVSDESSWLNTSLIELVEGWRTAGHFVRWVHAPEEIQPGDCAFFLGCGKIVREEQLARNVHNIVVHESDLPKGRGWSPLTWQILEGQNQIPITLFEAAASIDSGPIYLQDQMRFQGDELVNELRAVQAAKTVSLCRRFINEYPSVISMARQQTGTTTYYPRRREQDSRLNLDEPLRTQFNLLRVVDNDRYPAFFEINGKRYLLKIEKLME